MELSSNDLQSIDPDSVVISFSEADKNEAWEQTRTNYNLNGAIRKNAYLNCLCSNIFLKYLKEELNTPISSQGNTVFSFWQLVNGTAINLQRTRIILIPSENVYSELRVPREWLDLADWVGNYYLSVELNLAQNWLQISGYATYQQLREDSSYDLVDETYTLEAAELIEDLNVMWAAREIVTSKRPQLENNPTITCEEAETLLESFSQSIHCLPRLELPFAKWGALLAEKKRRQVLLQKLQEEKVTAIEPNSIAQSAIELSQWFENTFVAGWKSLEAVLSSNSEIAFNFRKIPNFAIDRSIEGVKILDLGLKLEEKEVALLIGLNSTTSETIRIGVQLHPVGEQIYLPESLKIALLAPSGTVLQESVARNSDRFIQLKQFSCPHGQSFTLRVELGDNSLQEDFIL